MTYYFVLADEDGASLLDAIDRPQLLLGGTLRPGYDFDRGVWTVTGDERFPGKGEGTTQAGAILDYLTHRLGLKPGGSTGAGDPGTGCPGPAHCERERAALVNLLGEHHAAGNLEKMARLRLGDRCPICQAVGR